MAFLGALSMCARKHLKIKTQITDMFQSIYLSKYVSLSMIKTYLLDL